MRTYTTTTTVKNHQIVVQLPADFTAEMVEVNIIAQSNESSSLAEKLALVRELSGFYKGPIVETASMRRENFYTDDNV